jgi:glycosyltransferase involved in cell wall biosynthesis
MNVKNLYIVIPAKNEGSRIGGVLQHLKELEYRNVVVVNDGSTDDTAAVARSYGATVLTHLLNLGAGAATQTGIEYALRQGADVIVTLDGDHQHLPADIRNLITALREKEADIVIGNRFMDKSNDIPWTRQLYNRIANVVAWFFTGLWVNDSQSGMKAMNAAFARRATIHRNGFEFCVEMIKNVKLLKAQWHEAPISVVYTPDTMRKGQSFFSGVKMVVRMMRITFFS